MNDNETKAVSFDVKVHTVRYTADGSFGKQFQLTVFGYRSEEELRVAKAIEACLTALHNIGDVNDDEFEKFKERIKDYALSVTPTSMKN